MRFLELSERSHEYFRPSGQLYTLKRGHLNLRNSARIFFSFGIIDSQNRFNNKSTIIRTYFEQLFGSLFKMN